MNNLHETFAGAHLDFEITDRQAKMIAGVVSFMLGSNIEYEELTVIQLVDQKYTIMVNISGQRVEFCLTWVNFYEYYIHQNRGGFWAIKI